MGHIHVSARNDQLNKQVINMFLVQTLWKIGEGGRPLLFVIFQSVLLISVPGCRYFIVHSYRQGGLQLLLYLYSLKKPVWNVFILDDSETLLFQLDDL